MHAWSSQIRIIGCPETSVTNYQSRLHNIKERQRFHQTSCPWCEMSLDSPYSQLRRKPLYITEYFRTEKVTSSNLCADECVAREWVCPENLLCLIQRSNLGCSYYSNSQVLWLLKPRRARTHTHTHTHTRLRYTVHEEMCVCVCEYALTSNRPEKW